MLRAILASIFLLGCYSSTPQGGDTLSESLDSGVDSGTLIDPPSDCYIRFDGIKICECNKITQCTCAEGEQCMFYLLDSDSLIECNSSCLLTCTSPDQECEFDYCSSQTHNCSKAIKTCGSNCPEYSK